MAWQLKNGSHTQRQSHFFTFSETPPWRIFFHRFFPLCACVRSYIYFENSSFIYTQLSVYILYVHLYIYNIFAPDNSFQKIFARPICSSHASLLYTFILYYTYLLYTAILYKIFFMKPFLFLFFSSLHNNYE